MTPADKNLSPAGKTPEDLLREEIVADAKRQAERLLRKASKEAADLAAKTKEATGKECAKVLAEARANAGHRAALLGAKVPVEAGRYRAGHVEKQLDAIRATAMEKLASFPATTGLLVRLIGDAARICGGGSFVVSLSAADRKVLEADPAWREAAAREAGLDAAFVLSDEPLAPSDRGPVLRSEDGALVCDNRLDARLARLWPSLRCIIAERLGYVGDTKEKQP